MDTGLITTLIVVGVVVVLLVVVGIALWMASKSLTALQNRVDDCWTVISEQVERRAALVPSIADTVKGYATHETTVLDALSSARAETLGATDAASASIAEGHMQKALKSVFAIAEGYPQLQSSQEFLQLRSELVDAEDKIQSARRSYNGGVRELNSKIRAFPSSTFAKRRGLATVAYFETNELAAIAEPPRVQF